MTKFKTLFMPRNGNKLLRRSLLLLARFWQLQLLGTRGEGKMKTIHSRSDVAVKTQFLKIGLEIFPVYGDEQLGWSVEAADLYPQSPRCCRYGSIDEIFFALVNLNLCPEGRA